MLLASWQRKKLWFPLCVLIFFWGVFTLVAAASGQPPWFLAPCIAMLTYGYAFNMGFLNYYLSLGLASFSLALLWRGRGLERLLGLLIRAVHCAGAPDRVSLAGRDGALSSSLDQAAELVEIVRTGIRPRDAVCYSLVSGASNTVSRRLGHDPFYLMNGADQLTLYGQRYAVLGWVALGFGVLCVVVDVISRRRESSFWQSLRLPSELYFIAIVAVALLPENLRPSISGGWIGLLASRLTAITAIFGLCLMGCLKPRKWHLAGFGACAIFFFTFLYTDTLDLNRMESSAEQIVSQLPFGTRVIATIWAPPDSRVSFIGHIVDRACIGHCFSYANYEPSSGQFRIRAHPGSPVVSASDDDTEDMQAGEYEVQDEDLPLMEIFQCDEKDLTKLCIRDLASGEKNGRLGYKPPSN